MSICLIIKQKPGPVCPWRVVCRTTGFVGRLELPGGTARRRGSFKNDNGKGLRHEGKERHHQTQEGGRADDTGRRTGGRRGRLDRCIRSAQSCQEGPIGKATCRESAWRYV